jgi:hypothetical protein
MDPEELWNNYYISHTKCELQNIIPGHTIQQSVFKKIKSGLVV